MVIQYNKSVKSPFPLSVSWSTSASRCFQYICYNTNKRNKITYMSLTGRFFPSTILMNSVLRLDMLPFTDTVSTHTSYSFKSAWECYKHCRNGPDKLAALPVTNCSLSYTKLRDNSQANVYGFHASGGSDWLDHTLEEWIGVSDFMRRCADRSATDITISREHFLKSFSRYFDVIDDCSAQCRSPNILGRLNLTTTLPL